jgi:membrane-bound serine protease (ClpP class)
MTRFTSVLLSAAVIVALATTQVSAAKPKTTSPATEPAGTRIVADGWFAPAEPKFPPPKLPAAVTRAFVIPIHEPIGEKTFDAIRRKVVRCRSGGAEIIIFDMKTPGGRSDAMDNILRLILDDIRDVYTVAYVHPEAFSAGAVISLACTEIVVTPTAVIGDAMPIMLSPTGELSPMPKEERAKMESGMRGIIRTIAQNRGHSIALCEGMITLGEEVWLIRDRGTRELRVVDVEEYRGKVLGAPASTSQPAAMPPSGAKWEYVRTIDGPNSLVTLTGYEAINAGLATGVYDNLKELAKHYNIVVEPMMLEDTWSEKLVEFLTSPAVAGVLFFIGILGIYIEFNSPGHILPGVVGLICLAIFFGSKYLVGMAQWWEIALFVLGVLLILVEIFVLPGFGIAGIAGIVVCVVSLLAMLVPNTPGRLPIPTTDFDWTIFTSGAMALGTAFIAAIVAAMVLARYLPKVPIAGRLVLAPIQAVPDAAVSDISPIRKVKPGDTGVVEAVCRPVGKVRFEKDLLDATSEGMIIEVGAKVRILRREGNQLIVEKV